MSRDAAPHLEGLFAHDYAEWEAELPWPGGLPRDLATRAYWIGPGRFSRGETRYRHWLDGDGFVFGLAFDRGRLSARTRFVRSTKHEEEALAGRALYRTFGTRFPGDRLSHGVGLTSPVNVSVCMHGGDLLAFGEQGLPWALDPVTLDTRGVCSFGGQVNDVTPLAAHPKRDPSTGELFNFGVSFAAERPTLHVFRFDAGGTLAARRRVALPYPCSLHDFALSASYCVFHVSPYLLDVSAILRDGASPIEALSWQPERGSQLLVVDRLTGALAATVPAGNAYCLHLVNAFEEAGALTVDLIEYERPIYDQYQVIPDLFTSVPAATPARFVVDVGAGRIVARGTLPYACAPDFPSHLGADTGRPYADAWMLGIGATGQEGRKFFDTLVHADWRAGAVATFRAGAGQYLAGEPLALRDPGDPGRVFILCHRHDAAAGRSSVVAFDGARVSDGPLADIALPAPIPALFHAVSHP